ncbi:MAG TPA: GNAT family N-acetyltransferase [Vicinamibacterales bacterium]
MRAVRTYLEMTDPADLEAVAAPEGELSVERVADPAPALWRFLYTGVGGEHNWVDRLAWSDEDVRRYFADPALELWVLTEAGQSGGYFELRTDGDGGVEIAYFGLLPAFVGRGLGKFLLARAVECAWARGASRVWLHTSSLDHTSALPNYLARGFRVWKQEIYEV